MSWIFKSNTYEGRYMQLTISEEIDAVNNRSKLSWTLESKGGSSNYYTIGETTVTINGTQVYHKARTDWNSYAFPAKKGSTSGEIYVSHGTDGKKSITVSFKTRVYTWEPLEYGKDIALTNIDRVAPTVSLTVTPKSSTSLEISATSTSTADLWEYSLDGGSTWVSYSTTSGTSAKKTLTGLTSKEYSSIKVRARREYNQVKGTSAATSCDITLSTVSFKTSSITANSVYVAASSGSTCNKWEYSKDDGATWVSFSTTSGTSASVTISGLSPNTTYKIKVRVTKKANGLTNTTEAQSVKTLGGTIINSVAELAADIDAPVLTLNWTVYNSSYKHTLTIKNGSTSILSFTNLTGSAGTNNVTVSLTSAQRKALLEAMANTASFTATYSLSTYDSNGNQIGTASTKTATIKTTSATSAPTVNGYSYSDANDTTSELMDGDLVFVQTKSSLRVVFDAATPKNEATIAKYKVTIGSKSVESSTTTVDFGSISESGVLTMTLTAIDSRGWSAKKTTRITVIEFANIAINSWEIRRVNEVEETATLELTGHLSELIHDDIARNSITSVKYRSKKVSDANYGSWVSLADVTSNGDTFTHTGAFATFDPEYAYDIQVRVEDELSQFTVILFLNKGTPLLAYRSKRLGINTNHPRNALDVEGAACFSAGIHAVDTVSVSDATSLKESMQDWFDSLEDGTVNMWICNCASSGIAGLGAKGYWFIQIFRINNKYGAFWAYSINAGVQVHQASLNNGTLGNFAVV